VVEGPAVIVNLKVVGAGLGRTGTNSLMHALETLLDGPCHHMQKVFERDEGEQWLRIGRGETDLLDDVLADCAAAVDWPNAAYWEVLAEKNPDAVILLSTRTSGEAWFKSASDTIFTVIPNVPDGPWKDMVHELFANTFTPDYLDKDKAIAAYDAHNASVREKADPKRLLEWQATDGWEPICKALGLPVPAEPFPHTNSTEEFLGRGLTDQA
jgi:sulfotransferase family protein